MVHIEHFTFNAFQTCCSVAWDDNGFCAVIDPGCFSISEKEELRSFISEKGLKPVCIMLTHGHFDHIYGLADLVRTYNIPVYMDMKETYSFEHTNPYVCGNYGLPLAEIPAEECFRNVSEGDVIEVGDLRFEVFETPGHSVGGVCYLERNGKILLSGDTLFAGAIGRSDHPGGDYDILMQSIFTKLMCLDGDIAVYPGHGPQTDIATERMTNPFLMPFNEPYEE
jgi:glyoxylase-like metal-dependent hydrolase (beta-lactamase superfamily II)